ncbi:MAG: hypothetical protein H0V14_06990 [Chitinophagaceae bacterium]|nr:hypothetical protein [Chitinophagaceae bacterium]
MSFIGYWYYFDGMFWEARNSMIKKYTGNLNKAQQAEKNELNKSCRTADSIHTLPIVPVVLFTATLTANSYFEVLSFIHSNTFC